MAPTEGLHSVVGLKRRPAVAAVARQETGHNMTSSDLPLRSPNGAIYTSEGREPWERVSLSPMTKTRTFLALVLVTATVMAAAACWVLGMSSTASTLPVSAPTSSSPPAHYAGPVHYDVLAQLLAADRRSQQDQDWLAELTRPGGANRALSQPHPLLNELAPDFTLKNQHEQDWNLHAHLAHGPVVLVFYLGSTCSVCMHELLELNADLDRFHSLGAEVVAISADAPAVSRGRMEQFGSSLSVLSDPGRCVARAFGSLGRAVAPDSESPLHAAFVISRDGRVSWVFRGAAPLRNNPALLGELARLEHKQSISQLNPETARGTLHP